MKLHRGAVLYGDLGYIDGNVLGAGMGADEIVAAISKHGLLFSSSAPVVFPEDVAYATYDATMDTPPSGALGSPLAHTTVPGDHIPQTPSSVPVSVFYALHLILTHTDAISPHPPPADDPPVLALDVAMSGCNKAVVFDTESYSFPVSQSLTGSDGSQDPHSHYGFVVASESDACGASDDIGIEITPSATWDNSADYECKLIPSGIVVRKEI